MTPLVTLAEIRQALAENPDRLAEELLPLGSFVRHKYDQGPAWVFRPHRPEDADPRELAEWELTAEQWAEQMAVARLALRHDMKLDALQEGFARV
ncbi:hypothetical protein HRbin40_01568 [bacterium HR40]|nr:hypothetical protein HRbin40_01568 [bacterium HR40]